MKKLLILALLLASCVQYTKVRPLASPAGNDVYLTGGTYADLVYSQSGTAEDPIVIYGNNSTVRCVRVQGDYIHLQNVTSAKCPDHGIEITGSHIVVEFNTVTQAEYDRFNSSGYCNTSGGFGSAIKVRYDTTKAPPSDIIIRGNTVYKNCGEGIAVTRGKNVTVENNNVYDNHQVNIYVDNSFDVRVLNNRVSCVEWARTPGTSGSGIALGEEDYGTAWGNQLHDVTISGNVLNGCYFGIIAWENPSPLTNVTIDGNQIQTGIFRAISLLTARTINVRITNNQVWRTAFYIEDPSGVTLSNNTLYVAGVTPTPQLNTVSTSAQLTTALRDAKAGDVIYLRGGTYAAPATGWQFSVPVTITNYPNEIVTFTANNKVSGNYIFKCLQTSPAVDGVRIIGANVGSGKGIIMTGELLGIAPAIVAYQCDGWEVAGVEFRNVAYAIFQRKVDNGNTSADRWHVHDNFVNDYYRESGMQFNGNGNRIENNRIVKQTADTSTTYGCQLLNLLGNNNIVRGNYLERVDQSVRCIGIFFEWDLADANLIEGNTIIGVPIGMSFYGGDGNIVKGNTLSGTDTAFVIRSWADGTISYPCNFTDIAPLENDTSNPDWGYYYPNDCKSKNNRFENNTVSGFANFSQVNLPEASNVFASGTPTPTRTPTKVPTITPTVITPTRTPTATRTPAPSITPDCRPLMWGTESLGTLCK